MHISIANSVFLTNLYEWMSPAMSLWIKNTRILKFRYKTRRRKHVRNSQYAFKTRLSYMIFKEAMINKFRSQWEIREQIFRGEQERGDIQSCSEVLFFPVAVVTTGPNFFSWKTRRIRDNRCRVDKGKFSLCYTKPLFSEKSKIMYYWITFKIAMHLKTVNGFSKFLRVFQIKIVLLMLIKK